MTAVVGSAMVVSGRELCEGAGAEDCVLVTRVATLHESGAYFHGFRSVQSALISSVCRSCEFIPRDIAERDRTLKQLVPYVLVRWGSHYLSYRRPTSGRENRLWGKRSLGIGGHVNGTLGEIAAESVLQLVDAAARREMSEELRSCEPPSLSLLGLVNSDGSEVDAVHLGLVYLAETTDLQSLSLSGELEDLCFVGMSELARDIGSYETWSQIIIHEYLPHSCHRGAPWR